MKHISKKRLYYIFSLTLFLLVGCNKEIVDKDPALRFININLDQIDLNGNKQFQLVTESAYIMESSKSMNAIEPLLIIHYNNKPYYNITSKVASILDNGSKIILENNVYMESINNNHFRIESKKVVWEEKDSSIYMSGGVNSIIKGATFYSNNATYDLEDNTMVFNGIKDYEYNGTSPQLRKVSNINPQKAIWYGKENRFKFYGNSNKNINNIKD